MLDFYLPLLKFNRTHHVIRRKLSHEKQSQVEVGTALFSYGITTPSSMPLPLGRRCRRLRLLLKINLIVSRINSIT